VIFRQARRRAPGRSAFLIYTTWDFGFCILMVLMGFLYRFRRHGMKHVPREGPLIFVSNHQSHFDPPMVGMVGVDRPHRGFARSTLFNFKPFAWLISVFGAIPLRQGEGDAAAFKIALSELAAGRSILIFPEGSRTRDGSTRPFKRGVSLLIKRSGATVQPVAIEGAFDVWKIGSKRPRLRGWIEVQAGPPITAEELMQGGPDAALETLRRNIETMRIELRASLRKRTRGTYPAPGPADKPYWEHESVNITPDAVEQR
jgi:1-acyl-sn-glycerol-3-phosphate acyltransferase